MQAKLLTLCMALCAVCLTATSQNVPDYVPTDGLVAWWGLNGNGADESEMGNHGVVFGAIGDEDRWGSANSSMNFVNDGDRIEFGEVSTSIGVPNQGLTISSWFKGTAGQNGWRSGQIIAADYGPGDRSVRLEVVHDIVDGPGNRLKYYWRCPDENDEPVSAEEFSSTTWNHYVMTVDPNNSEVQIYLNGVEITELTASYNPSNDYFGGVDRSWMIGALYPSPNSQIHQFYGHIDDVGIWSRALTEEEILALYNAQLPFPGCIDTMACNFNAEANNEDGSCVYPLFGEDCETGAAACGEGTEWDVTVQACIVSDFCQEDLDGDGVIGVNDLMQLLSLFGTDCEAEDVDPELGEFTCGDLMNYHGYDYATVQIGEQCWFAENLQTTHYANGEVIPTGLSGGANGEWFETSDGAQAIFNNDDSNLTDYGRLYNWYAVDDSRGLCPSDWHVPSDGEYITLTNGLGGEPVAGEKLKSSLEDSPSWDGTNSSGFSGLAGGNRDEYGSFYSGGENGYFWSASAAGTNAWNRKLNAGDAEVNRFNDDQRYGFSVRCLKDTE